jgi:hypothetical protein
MKIMGPEAHSLETEEYETWLLALTEKEQVNVFVVIRLLEELGPHLGFPYSSEVNGPKYSHMRELRIQNKSYFPTILHPITE